VRAGPVLLSPDDFALFDLPQKTALGRLWPNRQAGEVDFFTFSHRHVAMYQNLQQARLAGTYTPFALVLLRGNWGWTLFATVWGVATLGILFKIFLIHRFKILGPLTYLGMGWLIVLVIKPAMELIPAAGLMLLLAGGLFYSFGLIFYAWKRLLFHHAIWHLFVLAGSVCHFFAVYSYVIS
jgi:channel protein (hemolysin III family)